MALALVVACAHGDFAPHGKAALLVPPLPYDTRAEAAGLDSTSSGGRGLAAYPNFAPGLVGGDFDAHPDPKAQEVRKDAYALMTKACAGSILIWREDSQLSATERALAAAAGVCMPHNDRVWALRFSCGPPPHGGGEGGGAPASDSPPPPPGPKS